MSCSSNNEIKWHKQQGIRHESNERKNQETLLMEI